MVLTDRGLLAHVILLLCCTVAVRITAASVQSETTVPPPQSHGWECGEIIVPLHWALVPADSRDGFEQLQVSMLDGSDGRLVQNDRVQVWRRNTKLFCGCGYHNHTRTELVQGISHTVQVRLHMSNGSSSFAMSAIMTATCTGDTVASCLGEASPLQAPVDTKVMLVLQDGSRVGDVLRLGTGGEGKERWGGGLGSVWWSEVGGATADKHCQYEGAKIELVSELMGVDRHLPAAIIMKLIPFDACSCMRYVQVRHIPVVVSLQRFTGPSQFSKHPRPLRSTDSIHAATDNNIHGLGGRDIQLTSSAVQHRVPRQASNRPPRFAQEQYVVGVAENSLPETVVTTVLAIEEDEGSNGQLSYSMSSTDQISETLFEIESATGIIRTRGKKGGGGADNWIRKLT